MYDPTRKYPLGTLDEKDPSVPESLKIEANNQREQMRIEQEEQAKKEKEEAEKKRKEKMEDRLFQIVLALLAAIFTAVLTKFI